MASVPVMVQNILWSVLTGNCASNHLPHYGYGLVHYVLVAFGAGCPSLWGNCRFFCVFLSAVVFCVCIMMGFFLSSMPETSLNFHVPAFKSTIKWSGLHPLMSTFHAVYDKTI